MNINDIKKGASLLTTIPVLQFAEGTKVKPEFDKESNQPILGASGKTIRCLVPNGGSLFFSPDQLTSVS